MANFPSKPCTQIEKNYEWLTYETLPIQFRELIQKYGFSPITIANMIKKHGRDLTASALNQHIAEKFPHGHCRR